MEIGNQIRQMRFRRGTTQEDLAQYLGVTAQAVSKWERGAATPDISLLPDLSAYFGVSIDDLFALSDDTRMERIQNMLYDDRYYAPADVESTREFLLSKGKREPGNGKVYDYLAQMENHLAQEHHEKAAEYAKEALRRDPELRQPHSELTIAMNGQHPDWNMCNHYLLIGYYEDFLKVNPTCRRAYMWLIDQLIDDYRLDEAERYCDAFAVIDQSYRIVLYRGMIAWQRGEREKAFEIWAKMEAEYPDEWCVYHYIGDYMVRTGRYDEAMSYYRKALDVQKEPPLLDPLQAMAQLCESRHDIPGALAARREEADRIANQWHITGEELDVVLRDIQRLERKQVEQT